MLGLRVLGLLAPPPPHPRALNLTFDGDTLNFETLFSVAKRQWGVTPRVQRTEESGTRF